MRFAEALTTFEQAIDLDPNFAYAHYGKGFALVGIGKKKEAEQAIGKAHQLGYKGKL
jgi:Flp pilus assembly protein TadD